MGGHSLLIFVAEHNCGAVERRFSEQATKGLRVRRTVVDTVHMQRRPNYSHVLDLVPLEAGLAKGDALFQSLLVFATLGYPKHLEVSGRKASRHGLFVARDISSSSGGPSGNAYGDQLGDCWWRSAGLGRID